MKRDARTTGADDASTGSFQTSTLGDDADAQSAPTVRLVNSIIERAATERASDIHLEPREIDLHVRMRIDGVLRTILTVPKELQASVISRLKIMGGMNTSERRVPQDGRANIRLKKQDIDLRINTLPTIHGETVGHPPAWTRARRCSTGRASAWRATTWRSTSGSSARTMAWC